MLRSLTNAGRVAPTSAVAIELLRGLSCDDFSVTRESPPAVYHNDVRRLYSSKEIGHALWFRLYFDSTNRHSGGLG